MSRARLIIEADASEVTRALGIIRGESKTTAAALASDFQKAASKGVDAVRKMRQEALREMAAIERGEQGNERRAISRRARVVKSAEDGAKAIGQSYRGNAATLEAAEERATKAAERESTRRMRAAEREAKSKAREAQKAAKEIEKAERDLSKVVKKEAAERLKSSKAAGGALSSFVGGLGHAALSTATGLHDQRQSARAQRAGTERTLGLALYQAGAAAPEVKQRMRAMTSFAASHGIASEELASAANSAQTEFSVLGDKTMSAGDREKRFNKFLARSLEARNTGNDIGEYNRLGGMLDNNKLDDKTSQFMLRYMGGAAQRGAVEMGDVTKSGMKSMVGRVALAQSLLGKDATTEQRQDTAKNVMMQTFAEMQVAKSVGFSPRQAGEALKNLNAGLNDPITQGKMLTNIRTKLGKNSAAESELFEKDKKTGKVGLKAEYRDALRLSEGLAKAGVSALDAQNMFHGGGKGNPQSMLSNQRAILGAFLGTDSEGKSYAENVRSLGKDGVALSDEDVNRGAGIFENDTQAQLTRNDETHTNAVLDNTGALADMSDKIAEWIAQNPMLMTALGSLTGVMGPMLASLGGKAATSVATAAAQAGGGGAAGLVKTGGVALASLAAGLAAGDLLTQGIDKLTGHKETNAAGNRDSIFNSNTLGMLGRSITGDEAAGNKDVYAQKASTGFSAVSYLRDHAKEFAALDSDKQAQATKIMSRIGLDTDTMQQLARLLGEVVASNPPQISVQTAEQARSAGAGSAQRTAPK